MGPGGQGRGVEADTLLTSTPAPSCWVPTLSPPPHQQSDSLKSSEQVGQWEAWGELNQESQMKSGQLPKGVPVGFQQALG